ncbi:MAG: family 78 glycoside hydrolase catalytic domain [Bacillota bacterium]
MSIFKNAEWVKPYEGFGKICPIFKKEFHVGAHGSKLKKARLYISALGVYEAELNGERIGDFVLAPGWTSYNKRIQYQKYDITNLLKSNNRLEVTVGEGWCVGPIGWEYVREIYSKHVAIIAVLKIEYEDGKIITIDTDKTWEVAESPVIFSGIYDGETFDARVIPHNWRGVSICKRSKDALVMQDGEYVKEIEALSAVRMLTTPKGETVIDFGQNLTGYVRFCVNASAGDVCKISHAEVLDSEGNFYTDNLRKAKQQIKYICGGGEECYNPHFTFQGFQFIRIDEWPGEFKLEDFKAIVVHSDIKRTGHFECSNPLLNKLYSNIIWGQKGNFLDIPTDCPQRDERLGWTGDAQVFVRTASYNFDVNKFFVKWLRDLKADQFDDGSVGYVIPHLNLFPNTTNSSGWADAAVICPWQIYLTYNNVSLLAEQFDSMKKWIDYIRKNNKNEAIWLNNWHFGDWLSLEDEAINGSTEYKLLIANAYYAYSTSLLVKAGKVLGKDMSAYETLHTKIVKEFKSEYFENDELKFKLQTAYALVIYFGLADDPQKMAKELADLIIKNDNKLKTGFLGTPYLLHVLSQNGYSEVAYSLMLQEEFPSWLFSVKMGATTVWEHWDGMRPDGTMWDVGMNSFNHYAYGAVADWMYGVMAGINTDESNPGFKHIRFEPIVDARLEYVKASIDTKYGTVASQWRRDGADVHYIFDVPEECTATLCIDFGASRGKTVTEVGPGRHEIK